MVWLSVGLGDDTFLLEAIGSVFISFSICDNFSVEDNKAVQAGKVYS